MSRRARRRAGRWVLAGVAVVTIGSGAAAATGFGLPGARPDAAAHTNLPPATATVTRQTLVDTQTESGELGYGDSTSLNGRLAGTVTGLPSTGTVIPRGGTLYQVDNAPVVLLYGTLPAYRALSLGTKGEDVRQFEQNLSALGYRGFTVDDTYSQATVDAVKKWQKSLGVPQTGTVDLGRVMYAAGPVRIDTLKAATGAVAGPGQEVLTYTGTARVVTVKLDVSAARLAKNGVAVNVKLPDGRSANGSITGSRTVIEPAQGNTAATTKIQVSVAIDAAQDLAGVDQATVDVVFTASQRPDVLTVPVAALLALAEGGYGVQVVAGGGTRIVAVQTGLFASGRVEVSGGGLTEGMTVGMPS